MGYSSNALREPTMDEILTSIREIIEESCPQTVQEQNSSKNFTISPVTEKDLPVTEKHDVKSSDNTDYITKNKNLQKQTETQSSLSVNDAMQVLAQSIGLEKEEEKILSFAKNITGNNLSKIRDLKSNVPPLNFTPPSFETSSLEQSQETLLKQTSGVKGVSSKIQEKNHVSSLLKTYGDSITQSQKTAQTQPISSDFRDNIKENCLAKDEKSNLEDLSKLRLSLEDTSSFQDDAILENKASVENNVIVDNKDIKKDAKPFDDKDLGLGHIYKEKVLEKLEATAEEALRPLVSQWLNENFSKIFDKVSREEIEKVIK